MQNINVGLDSDLQIRLHMRSGGYLPISPTPRGESAGEAFLFCEAKTRIMALDKIQAHTGLAAAYTYDEP